MTLQGEMTRTDRTARRSWTARPSTRIGLLLRLLAGLAAVGLVVLTWVNITVALGAAVLLLAIAVVLLARARDRLLGTAANHPTPRVIDAIPDESTVPYSRSQKPAPPARVIDAGLEADSPTVAFGSAATEAEPDAVTAPGAVTESESAVGTRSRMPREDPPETTLVLRKEALPALTQLAAPPVEEEPASDPVPVTVGIAMPDQPAAVFVVVSNVVIGRGQRAGLTIDDPTISRQHASLIWRDEHWCLRPETDVGRIAINGETLRGTRLVRLTDGDEILLGARGTLLTWGVSVPDLRAADPSIELMLVAGANTTPGARLRNEDCYLVGPALVAVADGAGGEPAGATASATAIDVLASPEVMHLRLPDIVAAANNAVLAGQSHPSRAGMASTLDIVRLTRQRTTWMLEIAHLGDGVVFLQKRDGSVHRLTTPHRSISPDGRRTWLERALGSDVTIEAQYDKTYAEEGQRLVLATDGLLDHFGEERLVEVLCELFTSTPRRVANALVRTAVEEDVQDNVTVVVADVQSRPLAEEPARELTA